MLVRKGYPFFVTIASDRSVNKVIDDIEWHEVTVWAFDTLEAASTKGAIMKLGDQRTRLERRRGWYTLFCNDGDKFSSLIQHDCTNCSNGYIDDPVSIQAANISCLAIHISNYMDI